jgi:predicted short-subunit dehydrogenase-like oxidoreductase (DUF2520 family)
LAVIGAGRVGTALAVLWERAGHRIVGASGHEGSRARVERYLPSTPFLSPEAAARAAETVVLGVTDELIAPTCASLSSTGVLADGQRVLHLSGTMGLDLLEPARDRGAQTLSLHPLQSFPDVDTGLERMPGSGVAVTAETEEVLAFGESLARALGGVPFRLVDSIKPLYHSAAVFCANYLVTVEAAAEQILGLVGVPDPLRLLEPLARTAFDRTFAVGPSGALTGPAVRGDIGTIRRNLGALAEEAPEAVDSYVALARIAAAIAERSGRLSAEGRLLVDEELRRWR